MRDLKEKIGVIVIGRNEGKRLERCLQSLSDQVKYIVYVDSGSTDASVAFAKSRGVDIVQLDMRIPFSAGRARNEGFQLLTRKYSNLKYFQFIDGDCEMSEGWLSFAVDHLIKNKDWAIVAGRRKEKFPEATIYTLLCDIEWNTPIGEAKACGGDFMIRKEAFLQMKGFNPEVIAGEEPDLCYRLRKHGWLIHRLNHPMTLHDANITRFSQWWKRAIRSGHAYAQGYNLHSGDGLGYCYNESIKIWLWGFIFPTVVLILAMSVNPVFFYLYLTYFVQFVKIAHYKYKQPTIFKQSVIYSFFTVIGRWPQLIGQVIFLKRKMLKSKFSIIEYS